MSRKSDNQKNRRIRVFARCRPLDSFEILQRSPSMIDVIPERDMLFLKDRNTFREYYFDNVFPQDSEQISVYKTVVEPLIHEVLLGYHCTVFAYGQTGTGKTYTMEGVRSNAETTWEDDPAAGIIPRSMHQLFEELDQLKNTEYSVKASFLEIHNENVYDLLATNFSKLSLYEDPSLKDSVKVRDLKEVLVKNKDEVYAILDRGTSRRHTAETLLNATSCRSHTIFTVTVNITEMGPNGEKQERCGKLNLVDLAGSENVRRSGAVDKREAGFSFSGHINQSLLTLGRVITSLIENQQHIPYRESKLTRLLQFSLGGHAKTSIIVTFSPALCCLDETISTLEYAAKAKYINIKPEVNRRMLSKALIMNLTEENERLRAEVSGLLKDLKAARDGQGFFMDADNYAALVKKIALQDEEIEALKAENKKLQRVVDLRADDVDKLFEKIERKQDAAFANEDFCDKLRLISQEQHAFLQDMVANYEREIIEFSELFQDDQDRMKDVLARHKEKTKTFHDLISTELKSLLNGFSSQLYEEGVGDIVWTNDLSKDLQAMKNKFVDSCDLFLKERLPSLLNDMAAENDSLNEWVINIHKSLEEKINEHKSALEVQTSEERRLLGVLRTTLDSYSTNHQGAMKDYNKKVHSLVFECQDEIAKILNFCANLQKLMKQSAQYENISMFDSSALQLKSARGPLKTLKTSVCATEEKAGELRRILEAINVNQLLQKQDIVEPAVTGVSKLLEALCKLQTDNHEKVTSNFKLHDSTVQDNLQNNKCAVNTIVDTFSEELEGREDYFMAHIDTLGSLLAHSSEIFSESEDICDEAATKMKDGALKRDLKMEKFLLEVLAKLPISSTPQRRSSKSCKNYVHRLVRHFQAAGLKSCFKGNDDAASPNCNSILASQDASFASSFFDSEAGESDISVMADIVCDGKNKENCIKNKRHSLPSKRKSFRFSRSSDKPLTPSNQSIAGPSKKD